ncbi:MAG: hypothetical protein ACO1OO_13310 [Flavisolibacter sp.]
MKKFWMVITVTCFQLVVHGQLKTELKIDRSASNVAYWNNWVSHLTEMGIESNADSLFVRPEVIKAMTDSSFRNELYPAQYNWTDAVALLQRMELKPAFWHLMNLYETDVEHRSLIVGTFVAYDSLVDMAKVLTSTFYTYGFADPRVCRVENNKPNIYRPDILEKGLMRTKELVNNIFASREMKKEEN